VHHHGNRTRQLIVPGFQHPDFNGEIIAELQRLRDSDTCE
jgi:hypothetical protein